MSNSKHYSALLIFLCISILSNCKSAHKKFSSDKQKPNFVFILVDDLGWRDTETYGSTFYQTPNIDILANQGMKFLDAYATAPACSPSRYSIQTGKYPADIHLTDWIPGYQNMHGPDLWNELLPRPFQLFMPLPEITIGEALKGMGYKTFFAGKWHLSYNSLNPDGQHVTRQDQGKWHIGNDSLYWPKSQGYDINKGGWGAGSPGMYDMGGYFSPYHNPRLKDGPKNQYLTDRLTSETIQFIDKQALKDEPFFAFLSFYSVHTPIQPKPKLLAENKKRAREQGLLQRKTFIRNKPWMKYSKNWKERIIQSDPAYASMVESVDQNVGRVMKKLKTLNIDQNTVVFFFSDNGGLSTASGSPTSNLPLRAGKGWMYEGGIRDPLIVRWPGRISPGSISRTPVSGVDFYPTMLDMAGTKMNTHRIDGKSLMPILSGRNPDAYKGRPLFWHYPHYNPLGKNTPASAVRKGNYKLIRFYEESHYELYNLKKDIGEKHNILQEKPDKAAQLKKLLSAWLDSVNAKFPRKNPNYNPNYVPEK